MADSPSAPDQPDEHAVLAALVVLLLSGAPVAKITPAVEALLAPLGISAAAAGAAVGLLYAHVGAPEVLPAGTAIAQTARVEWARRAAYVVQAGHRLTESARNTGGIPGAPVAPVGEPSVLPVGIPAVSPGSAAEHVAQGEQDAVSAFGRGVRDRLRRAVDDPFRPLNDTGPLDAQLATERRYLEQHLDAVRLRREAAMRVDAEAAKLGTTTLGWHAQLDERTTPECRQAHGHNFEAGRPPAIGYPGTPHGGTCRCKPGLPFPGASSVDEFTISGQPSPRSGAEGVAVEPQ